MLKFSIFSLLVILTGIMTAAPSHPAAIIPQPKELRLGKDLIILKPKLVIHWVGSEQRDVAWVCQEQLNKVFGAVGNGEDATKIHFTIKGADPELGKEGYILEISKESGITIRASHTAGHFYGFQSLLQMLPSEKQTTPINLRTGIIKDKPRFAWRGMHLDESRHFFGKEFVKRYIGLLSAYKMNVFHWHLIDDGGWRIEIKKYPRLTTLGGFRRGTSKGWSVTKLEFATSEEQLKQGNWYGGFYTQKDIKEIVAYAKARHVRVIPEIEMPGHCLPAITTYPKLACGGDLKDDGEGWTPSRQNSYCAGKESSYEFLKNVLTEVMELFPDEYIHIGGDEVIHAFWNQCPDCKKTMRSHKLKNTNGLQSHFVRRMEKFINSNNKRLIGWDEITHGGLAPNATVMFWIGMGAVPETVKKGHDVIMTPMSPCYFDHGYASNSIERVYQWNPVPKEFIGSPLEKKFLGAQANIWTENMETPSRVEYMIMPRMIAMAETLWTATDHKDLASFLGRLDQHYPRLDAWRVNYKLPLPRPDASAQIFAKSTKVTFHPAPTGFSIHYTIDGSKPTAQSPVYQKPIDISQSIKVRSVMVKDNKTSDETHVECVKFSPRNIGKLEHGLIAQYAEGEWKFVPDFSSLSNVQVSKVNKPDLSIRKRNDNFSCRFMGFVKIPQGGRYTFTLGSDDGSVLRIAGATIVDHDGPHGYSEKSGTVVLQPGIYPFELSFLEVSGNEQLDLTVTTPSGQSGPLPASAFFRSSTPTVSTAKIVTNFPAQKGHGPDKMIDGSTETYYWISRAMKKDESIKLELPIALPTGQNITIRTGLPKGGDRFDGGVLEASIDGKNWKVLSDGKAGLLTATLTRPLKHFRLRATRNIPHWVVFREIELPTKAPIKTTRGHALYKGKRIPITLSGHLDGFEDLEPRFDEMAKLYFKIWPKLINMLGSPIDETHHDVILRFQEKMNHPAHASGKTIVISANHLRKNPSDTVGVFVHELTHIIQRYGGLGWFVEGTADYTRFKLKNDDNWANRCRKHINYNKPLGAYWSSAAFLLYLEDTYKKPIVRTISMALRAKKYSPNLWKKLTGKTLEELCADYKKSGWKPKSQAR